MAERLNRTHRQLQAARENLRAMFRNAWTLAFLAPLAVGFTTSEGFAADEYFVYFASRDDGILVAEFNSDTGEVSDPKPAAADMPGAGFLAIHPNSQFLYSTHQPQGAAGQSSGSAVAYAIDPSNGSLRKLNEVDTRARSAHIAVDATGKLAAVANYGGGNLAAMPILPDGSLGEISAFIQHEGSSVNPTRQDKPHPHSVNFSPDSRFLIVPDLGLDKLVVYKVDTATGALTANDPPFAEVAPGAGPRHFIFHPNGKVAYVLNEIGSTVTAFDYDAGQGAFNEIQTISTLPEGFDEQNGTAEIRIHPSEKFLYASNRGHDSIAAFEIDPDNGRLTYIECVSTQGEHPRNFNLSPGGKFLLAANMNSDNIVIFRIDEKTGRISPTGEKLSVAKPMCVRFVKRG